jgi:hypothetical protein
MCAYDGLAAFGHGAAAVNGADDEDADNEDADEEFWLTRFGGIRGEFRCREADVARRGKSDWLNTKSLPYAIGGCCAVAIGSSCDSSFAMAAALDLGLDDGAGEDEGESQAAVALTKSTGGGRRDGVSGADDDDDDDKDDEEEAEGCDDGGSGSGDDGIEAAGDIGGVCFHKCGDDTWGNVRLCRGGKARGDDGKLSPAFSFAFSFIFPFTTAAAADKGEARNEAAWEGDGTGRMFATSKAAVLALI